MAYRKYKKLAFGIIENKHGVRFTKSQQNELKRLAQNNRMKRRYHDAKFEGIEVQKQIHAKKGKEPIRFKPNAPHADFSTFKSKREYNAYIQYQKKVSQRDYVSYRLNIYRDNIKTALTKTHGKLYPELLNRVVTELDALSDLQFQELIITYARDWVIGYLYNPSKKVLQEALHDIGKIKGMSPKQLGNMLNEYE